MDDEMTDMMSLKCREGDLAFIISDESGCEDNIGRIVRVVGSLRMSSDLGACWLIEPEHDNSWRVVSGSQVLTDVRPFQFEIEHPDSWMIPIRSERHAFTIKKEVAA